MSHTDGPWWACPPDEDSENWEIEDGYGHTATVYGDDEPAAANARLMAAAPELLAVAKLAFGYAQDTKARFIDHWDGEDAESYNNLCDACDAVIAKAEGRE